MGGNLPPWKMDTQEFAVEREDFVEEVRVAVELPAVRHPARRNWRTAVVQLEVVESCLDQRADKLPCPAVDFFCEGHWFIDPWTRLAVSSAV